MKVNKILYYVFTCLMSGIFLFSAYMYFSQYSMVEGFYEYLGFPTWIIYPLAILKILGLVAVWSRRSKLLLEWAYAGFFFDAVLAEFAHGKAGDGWFGMAALAIAFVLLSRYFYGKSFKD